MADILQKIKNWDFTSKDSSITMNLDYADLGEINDIIDRKLWFVDEVDEGIIGTIVYSILRYNAEDKGIPTEKRKPIYLYISSPGGSVYDGLGLCSAIQTSKTPIYTINLSECCSMGLAIFICGTKRYTMPNSVFLMHEGYVSAADVSTKAKDRIDFDAGTLSEHMKDIILNHTKLTKKMYNEKYRQEWYFLPETAKKYGFTDYIIGEDCELDEIL